MISILYTAYTLTITFCLTHLIFECNATGPELPAEIEHATNHLTESIGKFDNGSNAYFNFKEIDSVFSQLQPVLAKPLYDINNDTKFRTFQAATFSRLERPLSLVPNIASRAYSLGLLRQGAYFDEILPSVNESINHHRQFSETLLKVLRCRFADKCYRKQRSLQAAFSGLCQNAENPIHTDYVQTACVGMQLGSKRHAALGIATAVRAAISSFIELPACRIALRTGARNLTAVYDSLTECLREDHSFPEIKTLNRTQANQSTDEPLLEALAAKNDNVSATIDALAMRLENLPLDAFAAPCGAVFGSNLAYVMASPLRAGLKLKDSRFSSKTFKYFRIGQNFYDALRELRTAAQEAFQKFEGLMEKMDGVLGPESDLVGDASRAMGNVKQGNDAAIQMLQDRQQIYLAKVSPIIADLSGPLSALFQLQEMTLELAILYATSKGMSAEQQETIEIRKDVGKKLQETVNTLLSRTDTEQEHLRAWQRSLRSNQSTAMKEHISKEWLIAVIHATRPFDDLLVYENPFLDHALHQYNDKQTRDIGLAIALALHDSAIIPDSSAAAIARRFSSSFDKLAGALDAREGPYELREFLDAGERILAWLRAATDRVRRTVESDRLRQLLSVVAGEFNKCNQAFMAGDCRVTLGALVFDAEVFAAELTRKQPSIAQPRWLQVPLLDRTDAENELKTSMVHAGLLKRLESDNKKFVEEFVSQRYAKLTANMDLLSADLVEPNSSTDGKILVAFMQASDAVEILSLYLANAGFLAKALRFQLQGLSDTIEHTVQVKNLVFARSQPNSSDTRLQTSYTSTLLKHAHRIDVLVKQCEMTGARFNPYSSKYVNLKGPVAQLVYGAGAKEALQLVDNSRKSISKAKTEFEATYDWIKETLVQQNQALRSIQESAMKILAGDA